MFLWVLFLKTLIKKGDSYIIKIPCETKPHTNFAKLRLGLLSSLIPEIAHQRGRQLILRIIRTHKTQPQGKAQIHLLSQAFKAKSQNSSPEWYTAPSSGIYRDFDYSDLATSSYLLGTHHEIIHLQFGQ